MQLQAFVSSLSTEQLHQLCMRILCGHGGVDLARSLLRSGQGEPDSNPEPNGTPRPSWCVCNKCVEMDTTLENVCCGTTRCITDFEAFFSICVDHLVLTVAILNRVDIRADPIDYSPSSYRKAAYRQYILWMHGYLGRGNRRVVPSCVVLAIRRWYPSPTGLYMGFREYWNIAFADCNKSTLKL